MYQNRARCYVLLRELKSLLWDSAPYRGDSPRQRLRDSTWKSLLSNRFDPENPKCPHRETLVGISFATIVDSYAHFVFDGSHSRSKDYRRLDTNPSHPTGSNGSSLMGANQERRKVQMICLRWTVGVVVFSVLASCWSTSVFSQGPKTAITNSLCMRFVRIPNGTFKMGSANERFAEKKIENDFYLGVYEITQSQYQKVMGENPSHCQGNRVKHWSGE